MADNNNTNWTAWVASAGAFGVGTAVSFGSPELARKSFQGAETPIFQTAENVTQRTLRTVVSELGPAASLENYRRAVSLQQLNTLSSAVPLEAYPSLVREWNVAVESVLPNPATMGGVVLDPANPFPGIQLALQKQPTPFTQDIFSRFHANVQTIMSTGQFGELRNLGESTRIPAHLRATKLQSVPGNFLPGIIDDIKKAYGEDLLVERVGTVGQGELRFKTHSGGRTLFTLPESFGMAGGEAGLVRYGEGLRNVAAPGMFSQLDETGQLGRQMSFTEYKARGILKSLQGAKAAGVSPDMAIASAAEAADKYLDYMEPSLRGKDFGFEAYVKGRSLTVLNQEGKALAGIQKSQMLETLAEQGMTPYGTKGKVSLIPAEELYGGFTEALDPSTKPWQWIRGYEPTTQAQSLIEMGPYGGKEFDFLDSPAAIKHFNGPSGPRMKTLYLSDTELRKLADMGFPVGDGELLVNRRFKGQMQVARTKNILIKEVTDELSQAILGSRGEVADISGMMLGRGAGAALERAAPGSRLLDVRTTMSGGTQALNLLVEETIDMQQFEKQFGGLKGMARSTGFGRKMAGALGMSQQELQTFGAIGRLADIENKTEKLLQQQFSGVMLAAQRRGVSGQRMLGTSGEYMRLINDPSLTMSQRQEALVEMMDDLQLSPAEREGILSGSRRVGISRLHFGGTKLETGAGKMGTMEPRILSMLEAQGTGFSQGMGSDLVSRVLRTDPDKMLLHSELRKSIASMAPGFSTPRGTSVLDIMGADAEDLTNLSRRGDYIKTNIPDMPSVYVPGYEQFEQMRKLRPQMIDGQLLTTSPSAKVYKELIQDIRSGADPEQLSERITGQGGYLSRLYSEYAPAGKGQAALARGPVQGTRFLKAVSGRGSFYQHIAELGLEKYEGQIIGVPKQIAEQMFQEMESIGEEMGDIALRFRRGEAVGAAVARHPFIGPYSMQPALMIGIEEAEPMMFVPERTRTMRMRLEGKIIERDVTTGMLAGLALDKDGDIPMALAVNKDMEAKIKGELGRSVSALDEMAGAYESHNIRMQLLKAKAGTGATVSSRAKELAAGGVKVGIADEFVGQLSVSLTRAREAVVQSSLDQGAKLRSLGLLEWLEQQPISGKHLDAARTLSGAFEQQMASIRLGVSGDPKDLQGAIQGMLAAEVDPDRRSVIQGLLGKEVGLEESVKLSSGAQLKSIQGFDLERTTQDITGAMRGYMSEVADDMTQKQVGRWMTGRGSSFSRNEIDRAMRATDILDYTPDSGFKAFQKGVIGNINRAHATISARVKPLARPLTIGLAAAGVAAFMFSGPPDVLGAPERQGPSAAGMTAVIPARSSDHLPTPEVDQQILGEPGTPDVMRPSAYDMDEGAMARHRALQARINASGLTLGQRNELTARLQSRFPGKIDVSVRDYRRSLNPHTVSDMLE